LNVAGHATSKLRDSVQHLGLPTLTGRVEDRKHAPYYTVPLYQSRPRVDLTACAVR